MPFDTLSPPLQEIAAKALAYCKQKYGKAGLKTDEGIADAISWRPTFFLTIGKHKILAVEVEDVIYPSTLKGAAHEIGHYDFPIAVYQICSLEAFQKDPKQERINLLKKHGFGIMTVDEDGVVVVQSSCGSLAQHISPGAFETAIKGLSPSLKVAFRAAYDIYINDPPQGLQLAGQAVEAIVDSLASTAVKKIPALNIPTNQTLSDKIDSLWANNTFKPHRAALGSARGFVKEFRNAASHAPKTAKEAAERIRGCKNGFLDAIAIAVKLRSVAVALHYTIKVHTA